MGRSALLPIQEQTGVDAFAVEGYTEVLYLGSEGNDTSGQYIDTELLPSETKDMDFNIVYENTKIAQRNHVLSTSRKYNNKTNYYYVMYQDNGKNRVSIGSTTGDWQNITQDTKYDGFQRVKTAAGKYVNMTESGYKSGDFTFTQVPQASFLMFTCNYYGTEGPKYFSTGNIYSCYITEDYKVVRNFIPCKRNSDSAGGMYDLAGGKFYTNKGTGDFIYPASDSALIPVKGSEDFDKESGIAW